jgi:circadian clock protein KaiC
MEKLKEKSKKVETGIEGLDVILKGGLEPGRGLLLIGGPGTGKTILLSEFLYQGITKFKQNGVFVTFEERPNYIVANMKSFNWDLDSLVKQEKLLFVDASPNLSCEEISDCYDLMPLIERIKYAIKKNKAERVVIDGLGSLFHKFSQKKMIRDAIYSICDELKSLGILYLISSEKSEFAPNYSVEEYVADGVIDMSRNEVQHQVERNLEVIKLRGASYISGKVTFEICSTGICLYPKIQLEGLDYKKRSARRCKFGIPELDKALGGGLPEGSISVIVGNTGTGKSTLAMHFLKEGLEHHQKVALISFKDSTSSFIRLAEQFGWNFAQYAKDGRLQTITEIQHPDKLLYTIIENFTKHKIKRVVIDSIAFIDPTSAFPNDVTNFYITLMRWLKINGITGILNYLTLENEFTDNSTLFSSLEQPLRRVLNAIPDGIITMRYLQHDGQVNKQLNILKLRGSFHRKDYFDYNIDNKGFQLQNQPNNLTKKK